jgi:hypothetical protein
MEPRHRRRARLGDESADARTAISDVSTINTVIGGVGTIGSAAGFTAAGTAAALGIGEVGAGIMAGAAAAGPYVAAAAAIAMIIFSFFDTGPSKAWLSFPTRVKKTLDDTVVALRALAVDINDAQNESDLLVAIDKYKHTLRDQIGIGYTDAELGGPWDIITPPGATGTAHEGKITANFGPITDQIRQLLAAKRAAFAAAMSGGTPPSPSPDTGVIPGVMVSGSALPVLASILPALPAQWSAGELVLIAGAGIVLLALLKS